MKTTKSVQVKSSTGKNDTVTETTPARRVRTVITREHVDRAHWSRFQDPVSLALRELLNEDTCVYTFWQSDGWRPKWPNDEAEVRLATEISNPDGSFARETTYETKLPRRAELAMKRLANVSRGNFEPTPIVIDIPLIMLKHHVTDEMPTPPGIPMQRPLWATFVREKVIQYYDGPKALLKQDRQGQHYLVLWRDHHGDTSRWLHIPLSPATLRRTLTGEIPVANAIQNADFIFFVDENTGRTPERTFMAVPSLIPQHHPVNDLIPHPDVTLSYPPEVAEDWLADDNPKTLEDQPA